MCGSEGRRRARKLTRKTLLDKMQIRRVVSNASSALSNSRQAEKEVGGKNDTFKLQRCNSLETVRPQIRRHDSVPLHQLRLPSLLRQNCRRFFVDVEVFLQSARRSELVVGRGRSGGGESVVEGDLHRMILGIRTGLARALRRGGLLGRLGLEEGEDGRRRGGSGEVKRSEWRREGHFLRFGCWFELCAKSEGGRGRERV